ncbi:MULTISPECIES: hypothetical protein [unclassified Pedobacter]|uniref:hypothetical protein n=1 Tax=unclassified Pedobacter TaxID=2628915 RepID=UPI001E2BDD14|nr:MULTISPECIES: hypothetical protein [unclassified Pedobacter]
MQKFNNQENIYQKLTLTKFTSYYFILVGLLIGFAVALPLVFPGLQILVGSFWLIFGFIAGITYIAYFLAYVGINRNPEAGVMAILGSVILKMIFCMAFVLIYSINTKENGLLFVVNFFSVYLLFTAFEMYCLLRNLRHQNLK